MADEPEVEAVAKEIHRKVEELNKLTSKMPNTVRVEFSLRTYQSVGVYDRDLVVVEIMKRLV